MSLPEKTRLLDSLFADCRLLPLLNIERLADVLPLADALSAGGVTTLEITLRTPLGIDAIALLRAERVAQAMQARGLAQRLRVPAQPVEAPGLAAGQEWR